MIFCICNFNNNVSHVHTDSFTFIFVNQNIGPPTFQITKKPSRNKSINFWSLFKGPKGCAKEGIKAPPPLVFVKCITNLVDICVFSDQI